MDKYTASIDLSNACRSLYFHKVHETERFKEQMKQNEEKCGARKTSIDKAFLKLKSEMASLMEQDISLMEQLLTMNETVEEIKSRRLYGVSKESLERSLDTIADSTDSVISA